MDERIANENNAAFVKQCRDAHCACFGACVKHHVDALHYVCRLAGGTCDEAFAVTMGQHKRCEHVTVARSEAVHIVAVKPLTLEALVKEGLVFGQVGRIGGVDDFELANSIGHAFGSELGFYVILAAYDEGTAHARALILDGGAQHAGIIAFGEDHCRLILTGAGVEAAQDAGCRVHPRFEGGLISVHINDRAAGDACVHTCLGDGGRDHINQARVKRCRDDVVAPEAELFAIGHCDFVRDILARQFGQRFGAGDFHFVVDGASVDIERAAEEIGEAEDVVHLIGIIRAACGDDHVFAHGMGLFGCDLGVRIGHGEDHGVFAHGGDHLLRDRAFGGDAKEDIGAIHGFGECARRGVGGVG